MDDFRKTININELKKWRRAGKRLAITIGILFIVIVLGWPTFKWFTDYIWMETLGFGDVFSTILSSKIILGAVGFVLFSVTTFITLFWIRRTYMGHFGPQQLPPFVTKGKVMNSIISFIAIIIGLMGSVIVQGIGWEPALKLLKHVSFGITDPYFNMDVSFYMFVLPFLQFVIFVLLGLTIFFLLVEIGAYSVFHMYRENRSAQLHMGITLGIIGILLAAFHFLSSYGTLLTNNVNIFQDSVVHGLSYTDKLINIPKAYVLAAAALIGAIWMIIALYRGKLASMMKPIIIYIALLLIGQGASIVVQSFVVSPNEFAKEKPFLEHNLEFTRAAYGLDSIEVKEHPGNHSLSEEMVERNDLTLNNVRLNDNRPLLDIYNQIQTFRTYYKFNNVDIDRYKVDGNYEQVFIGARELSTNDLPSQAKTWVNRNLRYTHGYGIAMSHVNKVTKQGQPNYMVKNLPPEGDIDITRPQIYFGEEDYPNVIVNSKVDEFDYPEGESNETHRYEADLGIPLKGINKILFAINEGSFRMFVSDQLTKESQLLQNRNIMERVKKIAPFFEYDDDPYIFVREDGSLAWIIDAYVTAERYPYSEPHEKSENYIRNSVKVVIDAYTGEVDFYISDKEDPLLQTYAKIFPDLFTEEIPEDVQDHFRYPVDMFKIQAKMYGTYHMSNLEVFYNREDYWQFPTEKYFNKDIEMNPYYITMALPEEDKEEFVLMTPYTPKKRQNMIAWMGVRNDGDNYGEMFVYRFPKQKNIYGPQQIENRINQDSVISQQLNLWAQGGSEVIRGNILAIPIEDTVLYVEPIYIESSNETSLPEVKQVVMAYGEHIVMEETFEKSLDKILQLTDSKYDEKSKPSKDEAEDNEQDADEDLPMEHSDEVLSEVSDLFDAYQEALSNGDWEKSAEMMREIEAKLNEIKK